jgi:hypothetical protein
LKRILECPPSLLLSEARNGPPAQSSFWAAEGTVAHSLVDQMLSGVSDDPVYQVGDVVSVPPHAIPVNEEMFVSAYVFADFIKSLVSDDSTTWLEQVVHLDDLVGADALCFGHLDAAVLDRATNTLHVADFKYGRGIVVEVKDNPQLYAYAVGAMFSLLTHDERAELKAIRLHVVQPRLGDGGLHSITLTPLQLAGWVDDELLPTVRMIVEDRVPDDMALTPGSHCQFCPVIQECPAIHDRAQAMAKHVFSNAEHALPLLTNEDLARVLDQADLIEPWLEKLKALALERMLLGADVPGRKLVNKRGHRVWTGEPEDIETMLICMGLTKEQINTEPQLRTAAQIEKVVPKHHRDRFRALWRMESSGVTIAPASDARRALLPSAAVVFDKQQQHDGG